MFFTAFLYEAGYMILGILGIVGGFIDGLSRPRFICKDGVAGGGTWP